MKKGIDVSHYQKVNDWNAVKNDGISFVFLKATEGNTYVDPTFAGYVAGARAVGLEVGAYHFARFANPIDAKMEADFFLQAINGKDLTLPLVLDLETNDNKLSKAVMTECVKAFVDTIKATGQQVIVYTYKSFMGNFDRPADTLFWFARYGVSAPDVACDFWQYADNGKVAGISGNVDMDYFMGDVLPTIDGKVPAQNTAPVPPSSSAPTAPNTNVSLVDYLVSIKVDTSFANREKLAQQYGIANYSGTAEQNTELLNRMKGQPAEQFKTYVVKSGDTLSQIAVNNRVPMDEIQKVNGISDPNRINIGQIIKIPLHAVVLPKRFLQLPASATTWRVYPLSKAPVKGNEAGFLKPSKFGGLEYEILGNPQPNVYTIQTGDFGKVNIYATTAIGAKFVTK